MDFICNLGIGEAVKAIGDEYGVENMEEEEEEDRGLEKSRERAICDEMIIYNSSNKTIMD